MGSPKKDKIEADAVAIFAHTGLSQRQLLELAQNSQSALDTSRVLAERLQEAGKLLQRYVVTMDDIQREYGLTPWATIISEMKGRALIIIEGNKS